MVKRISIILKFWLFLPKFKIMRKLVLGLVLLVSIGCKKEIRTESSPLIDSLELNDTIQLDSIELNGSEGKTIFSQGGKTIIVFDTKANTGIININGKKILLDELVFTENNYEISGQNIKITAEDGDFKESENNCNEGIFKCVYIEFEGKLSLLENIKVKDCRDYN